MSQIDGTTRAGTPSPLADNTHQSVNSGSESCPSHLQRSHAAFLRDLPSMLNQHAGQWAAYAGNQRVAIGPSKRELYRQCLAAGHRAGDILICGIEPPRENILEELLEV